MSYLRGTVRLTAARTIYFFTLSSLCAFGQTIGGCPVLPANNIWNARVDTLPVHASSAAWVTTTGPTKTLHADFGSNYDTVVPGLPINLVPGTQPKVAITFLEGASESDPGPYPIPSNARIEGGPDNTGDRHILVVDTGNCILYETFYTWPNGDGTWRAYSGAKYDLRSNALRPYGWTSADAAGLPMLPGLVRYDEVAAGEIRHAMRFTVPYTRREFLWPARHFASSSTDPARPPMGARFRLKAGFDISSFTAETQVILTALKRYGMMIADNGSSWFVQGDNDPRWNNDAIATEWRRIPGSAFEAVDVSSLMENADSGAVRGTAATAALDSVSFTPASVRGGQSSSLRVNLTAAAPAGGVTVALGNSNPAAATMPPSAVVPSGASGVNVDVSTSAVGTATTATVTATLAGVSRQASLAVNPPGLAAISVSPSQVNGGTGAAGSVTLNGPAPSGGFTVSLGSTNTGAATVPASALVAAGQSSAGFAVTTKAVGADTSLQIQGSALGVTLSAPLQVVAPQLQSVTAALSGSTAQIGVSLTSPAPAGGVAVAITSSHPTVVPAPASITVSAGATSASATVTVTPGSAAVTVTITGARNGVTRQASITVPGSAPAPATLASLLVATPTVSRLGRGSATVVLSSAAPAGGAVITLSSSSANLVRVPATITVPAGASSSSFIFKTGNRAGPVVISAAYNGVVRTAAVTVQ